MYNNGAKIVQRYKKESTYTNKVINKKVINNEKLAIAGIKTYQQKLLITKFGYVNYFSYL